MRGRESRRRLCRLVQQGSLRARLAAPLAPLCGDVRGTHRGRGCGGVCQTFKCLYYHGTYLQSNYLSTCTENTCCAVWRFSRCVICVLVLCTLLTSCVALQGSKDKTIKMWDLASVDLQAAASADGTQPPVPVRAKFTQRAHDKDINSIAVAPNDKASTNRDNIIK